MSDKNQTDGVRGASVDRFLDEVAEWIAAPSDTEDRRLIEWLSGLGSMPSEASGAMPSDWLLRAVSVLVEGRDGPESGRRVLARRLGNLLARRPDVIALGPLPEDLLVNLFYLASSCTREASLLWPELLSVWKRHEQRPGPLLTDQRVGTAFRLALAFNQKGRELTPVWLRMVRGEPVPVLGNDWLEGVRGICLQPVVPDSLLPDDLGSAILALIESRRHDLKRARHDLKLAFQVVAKCRPGSEWALVLMADRLRLPDWAVDSLPKLFFENLPESGSAIRYRIWQVLYKYLADTVLRNWNHSLLTELCGGRVCEFSSSPEAAADIRRSAERIERERLRYPFARTEGIDSFFASDSRAISRSNGTNSLLGASG